MRWLEGITDSMGMNLGKLWRIMKDRAAWSSAAHGLQEPDTVTEQQQSYAIFLARFSSGPSDGLALLQAIIRTEFSSSPRIT